MRQEILDTLCNKLSWFKDNYSQKKIRLNLEAVDKLKDDFLTIVQEFCIEYNLEHSKIIEKSSNYFYITIMCGVEDIFIECYLDYLVHHTIFINVVLKTK